jgi:hypothetical protein
MSCSIGTMTRWSLDFLDTFDREDPGGSEGEGNDLRVGLALLWRKTLHEGVLPDGRPTFTRFQLSLRDGWVSVPISPTEPDATLSKLRAWVFPPWPPGTKLPEDAWKDGCHTAPHDEDRAFLDALAALHLRLAAGDTSAHALHRACARVLAHVAPLNDKASL